MGALSFLDRNHTAAKPGFSRGIVIVFDRLFGTYAAEDDAIPTRNGLVHNVDTVDPLVIAYGQFCDLIRDMIKAPSWGKRWRLMIKPPGWSPQAA
jgi:hypothetical protein